MQSSLSVCSDARRHNAAKIQCNEQDESVSRAEHYHRTRCSRRLRPKRLFAKAEQDEELAGALTREVEGIDDKVGGVERESVFKVLGLGYWRLVDGYAVEVAVGEYEEQPGRDCKEG